LVQRQIPEEDGSKILLSGSWQGSNFFVVYLLASILFFSNTLSVQSSASSNVIWINPVIGLIVITTMLTGIFLAINRKTLQKNHYRALVAVYALPLLLILLSYGFQIIEVILAGLIAVTMMCYRSSMRIQHT
jgi:lysylphosphatidylglycerol synthetase-like protein (DUF2156 family)